MSFRCLRFSVIQEQETLQKLVWKDFCARFLCCKHLFLQQIDMKYRRSYNRTDRRLKSSLSMNRENPGSFFRNVKLQEE